MPLKYPESLKAKAIDSLRKGNSPESVSEMYGIHLETAREWGREITRQKEQESRNGDKPLPRQSSLFFDEEILDRLDRIANALEKLVEKWS